MKTNKNGNPIIKLAGQTITLDRIKVSSSSDCSSPIVPIGTSLPCGTVAGVQSKQGERYYFITGGGVGYMPADLVEKQYAEKNTKES